MRSHALTPLIYNIFKWLGSICLLLLLFFGIILNLSINQNQWPVLVEFQNWLEPISKPLIAWLAFLIGFFKLVMRWVGAPEHWKTIQKILEHIQKEVFDGLPDGEFAEFHRVTLYRYQRFCLFTGWRGQFSPWGDFNHPWSGWLVPVTRAGPGKNPKTVFLAHSMEGKRFEGVAGATMLLQGGDLRIDRLPDATSSANDEKIRLYATETFVSESWLRKRIATRKPCSRSFYSMQIEIGGKAWGVLMIDSRLESLPKPQKTKHVFESLKVILEILLSK